MERSFEAVERRLDFTMHRASRRAMIWHEAERALSTADGRPLDPKAARAGVTYPFRQIGVLRLRLCLAVDAAPGGRHLLRPGEADLTLKLKGVDPARPPTWHKGGCGTGAGAALAVACCTAGKPVARLPGHSPAHDTACTCTHPPPPQSARRRCVGRRWS